MWSQKNSTQAIFRSTGHGMRPRRRGPTVTSSGVVRDGIAVSFRTHNSGFKGNIRYVDDILGLSEVVVFQIETATRMGRVTFKEAAGEDWVDAIFPFEEAFCIVR